MKLSFNMDPYNVQILAHVKLAKHKENDKDSVLRVFKTVF